MTTKKPEPDQRSPEEASRLARDVMRRMLEAPPQTHDEMTQNKPKKKSRKK